MNWLQVNSEIDVRCLNKLFSVFMASVSAHALSSNFNTNIYSWLPIFKMGFKSMIIFQLLTSFTMLYVLSFFGVAIEGIGGTDLRFTTVVKYSSYLQCPILFQPNDDIRLRNSVSKTHSYNTQHGRIPMSNREETVGLRVSNKILRSLVYLNTTDSECSGTMISPQLIITSASCLPPSSNPENLSVRLGIDGRSGELAIVDNWTVFENDEIASSYLRNELSVVLLRLRDSYPNVASMAVNSYSFYPSSNAVARFAAFHSDDQGIQADFPIESEFLCNTSDYFSPSSMICAGYSSDMSLSDPCRPRYVYKIFITDFVIISIIFKFSTNHTIQFFLYEILS